MGEHWLRRQEEIEFETSGHGDMRDVTESVRRVVERSGIRTGWVHVFNVGSRDVIGAIEFEPGLQEDLPAMLDRLMLLSREYGHE